MNITPTNLKVLYQGFRTVFDQAMQSAEPDWPQIAMRVESSSAEELYAWLGSMPGMREFLGEIVIQHVSENSWTIRNKTWVDTIGVPRPSVERDAYGMYNPMFSELGGVARQHPDELVAELLDKGFTTGKDYTGKAFFAAAKKHEPQNKKSTTFSNVGTSVLDGYALTEAIANLKSRRNNAGRAMKLGKGLQLIVPPALEQTAKELLQAEKNAAGATNILRDSAKLTVLPDLGSATAWFLFESGRALKPLIVQIEVEPQLTSLTDPANLHTFTYDEFLFKAYGRWNAGYGFPQFAYGSDGTA